MKEKRGAVKNHPFLFSNEKLSTEPAMQLVNSIENKKNHEQNKKVLTCM